jgi:membrane protein
VRPGSCPGAWGDQRSRAMSFNLSELPALHLAGLRPREVVLETWRRINDQAIMTRAAAISFYGIAALVPFMGLLIVLSAQALPLFQRTFSDRVDLEPIAPFYALLPADASSLLSRELSRLRAESHIGLISFGVGALLWLSSTVFVEIIDAMNAIRGLNETRPFWTRRLIAMAMTLIMAAILISATVTIAVWPQILGLLGLSREASLLATVLHALVVMFIVFCTFALALQVGPNTVQAWKWLTPGSVVGAVAVIGISIAFRIYTQNWGNYSATYGSLAGIVLLMSWTWLNIFVLLIAAVFNKVIEDASHLKSFGTPFAITT